MATPIENNTEALKALKAKADSLPGKAANVLSLPILRALWIQYTKP